MTVCVRRHVQPEHTFSCSWELRDVLHVVAGCDSVQLPTQSTDDVLQARRRSLAGQPLLGIQSCARPPKRALRW